MAAGWSNGISKCSPGSDHFTIEFIAHHLSTTLSQIGSRYNILQLDLAMTVTILVV